MKEKIKNFRYGIIILIVAILVSIPLFWKTFNYFNDDGIQHISRAFLTMKNLEKGQSTLVLPQLENNFGYSWSLFYGPLSSYVTAVVSGIFNNIIVRLQNSLIFRTFMFWNNYVLFYEKNNR